MRSDACVLAFDTSAAHCAAGLFLGDRELAARDEPMPRGQAERLLPMLEEILAEAGCGWRDLDRLAVCIGPGNFTGVRLGVAAARGLALALGIPAVGVSVFEALADLHDRPVLVALPARPGEIVFQAFDAGAPLGAPVRETGLPQLPPDTLCIGEDAAAAAGRLGLAAGPGDTRAPLPALARIAARRPLPAPRPAPVYLRPADATLPAEPPPLILDDA